MYKADRTRRRRKERRVDTVLGIDIAKDKFAVTLRTRDGKRRRKSCPNTAAGFAELAAWLARHGAP